MTRRHYRGGGGGVNGENVLLGVAVVGLGFAIYWAYFRQTATPAPGSSSGITTYNAPPQSAGKGVMGTAASAIANAMQGFSDWGGDGSSQVSYNYAYAPEQWNPMALASDITTDTAQIAAQQGVVSDPQYAFTMPDGSISPYGV